MYDKILAAKNTKDRLNLLNGFLQERRQGIERLYPQWDINQAMAAGRQYIAYVPDRGIVDYAQRRPRARKRYTLNLIGLYVRNLRSLLTQQSPTLRVRPATEQPDDIQKAKAADHILRYHRRFNRYRRLAARCVTDMLISGTAWMLVAWDPRWGEVLRDPNTNAVISDTHGRPAKQGAVRWVRLHPKTVFPTPEATEPSEIVDVFIERVMPLAEIRRRWPANGHQVKKASGIEDRRHWKEASFTGFTTPRRTFENHAIVHEWRLHGSLTDDPHGYVVQWADNVVLYEGPGLFKDGSLGLALMRFDTTTEGVHGKTYVEDLVDPQINTNKILSQAILHRERMIQGKWAAEKRSGINESALQDDLVGNVVHYNRGFQPPIDITGKGIDQTVFQELELTNRLMQDIGTQQSILRGQSDPAIRSYLQAELLKTQSNTTLSGPLNEIEDAMAEVARLTLLLVQARWTLPRAVKTVGENQVARVMELSRANIPAEIDVEVVAGSALPKSKAAEFEELQHVLKSGIFNADLKASDPKLFRQLMSGLKEYGGLSGMVRHEDMHIANAERENQVLAAGNDVEVREFEEDDLHLETHNEYRNSAAYDQLEEEAAALIDEHCMTHEISKQMKASGLHFQMPDLLRRYQETKQEEARQAIVSLVQGGPAPEPSAPSPPETIGPPPALEGAIAGAQGGAPTR